MGDLLFPYLEIYFAVAVFHGFSIVSNLLLPSTISSSLCLYCSNFFHNTIQVLVTMVKGTSLVNKIFAASSKYLFGPRGHVISFSSSFSIHTWHYHYYYYLVVCLKTSLTVWLPVQQQTRISITILIAQTIWCTYFQRIISANHA